MALAAAEQRLQIKGKEANEKLLQANGPSTQEVLLQGKCSNNLSYLKYLLC